MRSLEEGLPPDDGVTWFLRLYRPVTEGVEARAATADPRCVRWLDVVFANMFFRALRDSSRKPAVVPRAWAPSSRLAPGRDSPRSSSRSPG
jgi:Family of unknown function (DUF5995)